MSVLKIVMSGLLSMIIVNLSCQAAVLGFFGLCSIPNASHFILLWAILDRVLMANVLVSVSYCQVSHPGCSLCCLLLRAICSLSYSWCISLKVCVLTHQWILHMSSFMGALVLSNRSWYFLFHVHSLFTDINLCTGSHTSVIASWNWLRYFKILWNAHSSFLNFVSGIYLSAFNFLQSCLSLAWKQFLKKCNPSASEMASFSIKL